MEKHYFMSARTQFDNLGDALINKTLFDVMRQKGTLHLDCKNVPEPYKAICEIQAAERYHSALKFYAQLVMKRFKGHDVFYIIKPGHIFRLKDGFKAFLQDSITMMVLFILKILGIKIKRFGVSMGPFTPLSLLIEKLKAKSLDYLGYREAVSKKYLEENQFQNIDFCPDLLFYPNYLPLKPLKNTNNRDRKLTLAFSFRSSPLKREKDQFYMDKIKAIIYEIAHSDQFELIAISQVTHDYAFQRELIQSISGKIDHYVYDGTISGQEKIVAACHRADVIISNRLHCLLHGLIHGCHPIAFVTKENFKVSEVLRTANLDHLILDAHQDGLAQLNHCLELQKTANPIGISQMRAHLRNILEQEL